jgi:spore coat polysaccharide biosynthesis protein SpsF
MSKPLIILQARTNSSRLPGKSMLTIVHRPIAVLSAQRLSNANFPLIVATSNDPMDDFLVSELKYYGIQFFRGPLNNPFLRFKLLLEQYKHYDIVIRATADNLFPDGILCETIYNEFKNSKLKYFQIDGKESGVPEGVRLEYFYTSNFLDIDIDSINEYEKEHVTPRLISSFGNTRSYSFKYLDAGSLVATIDNFNDFIKISRVFENVKDPINIPWYDLVEILKALN